MKPFSKYHLLTRPAHSLALSLTYSLALVSVLLAFPNLAQAQAKDSDTHYGIGLGVIPSDEGYKGIGLKQL
ncbi:MAG: hypothetical protein IPQ12_07605 [Polaromonas sp.]|nr:hypothetical protein [Polaromonas sp.]